MAQKRPGILCATNKASLFSEIYECIHGFGMANCDPYTRAIDLQIVGPHSCDSPVSKSSGGEENRRRISDR